MEKKDVKIIGLSVNKQFGILQACQLKFDNNNRIIKVKGAVGQGKTTLQKGLQLGTQGGKTLTDKNLYGNIDIETQLLDGDMPVFIGCRTDKKGGLVYTIYTKDSEGNIIKNPIIDGVKATPSKYLEMLQTELTWKMDELTSENPTVQKKILLKLYQKKLAKIGVVFDKNNPLYKGSILDKIEQTENERNLKDAIRKQNGGISEDLKLQGFDTTRPETLPKRINTEHIKESLQTLKTSMALEEQRAKNEREKTLQTLKIKASELTNECLQYNQKLKKDFETKVNENDLFKEQNFDKEKLISYSGDLIRQIKDLGFNDKSLDIWFNGLPQPLPDTAMPYPDLQTPQYINFSEDGKVVVDELKESIDLVNKMYVLRQEYLQKQNEEIFVDNTIFLNDIARLENDLQNANEINKICNAVDTFFDWQKANNKVFELKAKYVKLLGMVDTGIEGLKIVPQSEGEKMELYLMYDGSHDTDYFNNPNKELRKLSSYSGTQKPVICLLIQNNLLNEKPKSMRYMYIDNIPMDKKTIQLLEKMTKELDLRIFLNITGDFEKNNLTDGEILIEGGEVFFN